MIGEGVPRGWIDLVAFREADGTLIVEETKTEIHDVGALQRSLGFYAREAWRVAEQLGWRPRRIVVICVVLDSDAVAERILASRALLRDAFPADVDATLRFLEDAAAPAPAARHQPAGLAALHTPRPETPAPGLPRLRRCHAPTRGPLTPAPHHGPPRGPLNPLGPGPRHRATRR